MEPDAVSLWRLAIDSPESRDRPGVVGAGDGRLSSGAGAETNGRWLRWLRINLRVSELSEGTIMISLGRLIVHPVADVSGRTSL